MFPTLQILQETTHSPAMDKPVMEKLEQFLVYEDQVHERFGWKFITEMENARNELHHAELDRAFEQGFLAAWKLWAEVSALSGPGMEP